MKTKMKTENNESFSIKGGKCITLCYIKKIHKEYDDFIITTFDY